MCVFRSSLYTTCRYPREVHRIVTLFILLVPFLDLTHKHAETRTFQRTLPYLAQYSQYGPELVKSEHWTIQDVSS